MQSQLSAAKFRLFLPNCFTLPSIRLKFCNNSFYDFLPVIIESRIWLQRSWSIDPVNARLSWVYICRKNTIQSFYLYMNEFSMTFFSKNWNFINVKIKVFWKTSLLFQKQNKILISAVDYPDIMYNTYWIILFFQSYIL